MGHHHATCTDPGHHVHDAQAFVRAVEKACGERGLRLTPIRARVLGLVAEAGKPVKLSDFAGKPVVLNFWASWCPPCKSEMPHFNTVYQDQKDEVVFLMIDQTDGQRETKAKGLQYVADQGFDFPIYFDTELEASTAYGISSIPTTLFINPAGKIVNGYRGAIDEATLRSGIESIKN